MMTKNKEKDIIYSMNLIRLAMAASIGILVTELLTQMKKEKHKELIKLRCEYDLLMLE